MVARTMMAGAFAAIALGLSTAPAYADEPTLPEAPRKVYSIEKIGKLMTNVYDGTRLLTSCQADKGGTCTISRSFSVTRTIGVALGVSRSFVSAELNMSSARTVEVRAACTSRVFSSNNQIYKAYPAGTRQWYKVVEKYYVGGKLKRTTKSVPLQAFNPRGVSCLMRTT
ncbi:hypothetical protein [Nonomuraea gerenzanensis]|uniref:hypothetical protein n=1 Tax=Nonomuraea gerenzanensis TaxID=93944 RepID=UPI001CD9F3EA|nr:hypothetical protein [Nonomuraea gerenzanensis]UBU08892.1 hypothetical protein LCN96_31455 [Nonomuraea gerenzanensis]